MEFTDHNKLEPPSDKNSVLTGYPGTQLLDSSRATEARIEALLGRIDSLCSPLPETSTPTKPELQFKTPRPVLGLRCPQCNKRALRKAKRNTFAERMTWFVFFTPYRCRYCRYREMRFVLDQ